MSDAGSIVSWITGAAAILMLVWYCLSIVIGGAMLIRNEIRLRRSRPKADDVLRYADQMEALYRQEAFRLNGEAMYAARESGDFDRHRFLRAVSAELVRRLASKAEREQRQR